MPPRIRSAMTPVAVRQWLRRHHLTLTTGSDMLGIARRTLQEYCSGRQPVPVATARHMWWMDAATELAGGHIDLNSFEAAFPDSVE